MGELFDFGTAIQYLKNGSSVTRQGWNGKGMWLAMQVPDENSKMTQSYIYMTNTKGYVFPWTASQTDMLSDDWMIV